MRRSRGGPYQAIERRYHAALGYVCGYLTLSAKELARIKPPTRQIIRDWCVGVLEVPDASGMSARAPRSRRWLYPRWVKSSPLAPRVAGGSISAVPPKADLLIATAPWVSSAAKPIFVIPITALEQPQH